MQTVKSTKDIERAARVFSLFGDLTRLKILRFLVREKTANVSDIAEEIEMSVACTSHHLQLLKDNGVVESVRRGNSIYYKLQNDPLIKRLRSLIS